MQLSGHYITVFKNHLNNFAYSMRSLKVKVKVKAKVKLPQCLTVHHVMKMSPLLN